MYSYLILVLCHVLVLRTYMYVDMHSYFVLVLLRIRTPYLASELAPKMSLVLRRKRPLRRTVRWQQAWMLAAVRHDGDRTMRRGCKQTTRDVHRTVTSVYAHIQEIARGRG